MGWDFWNAVETVGAFIIALSVLVFMYNVYVTMRRGQRAGNDPWDGRTLEWTIPSPPPEYNFATIPTVRARDPFWHDKYVDPLATEPHVESAGRGAAEQAPIAVSEHEEGADAHGLYGAPHHGHGIHMPSPSYFPLVAAVGFVTAAYGLLLTREANFWYGLAGLGIAIMCAGVYGWALEPVTDE
jgi:cytochrome c oxidase subunit 1